MTKLKITVTKEILEESKMCGFLPEHKGSGNGSRCAIALATISVFPKAFVTVKEIRPYGLLHDEAIALPHPAKAFIGLFDYLSPDERVEMKPFSFEIEIPNHIIDQINIEELRPLLTNHPTLALM